jgi:hypothetical protein
MPRRNETLTRLRHSAPFSIPWTLDRCREVSQERGRELDTDPRLLSQECQLLKIIAQVAEIGPSKNSSRPAFVFEHGGDRGICHVVRPQHRKEGPIWTAEHAAQRIYILDHTPQDERLDVGG